MKGKQNSKQSRPVPQPASPVPPRKSSSPLKIILIIGGIVVVSAVIIGGLISIVSFTGLKLQGDCTERKVLMRKDATSLEDQLAALTLDGKAPDQVQAFPEGDCLLATEVSAMATFTLTPTTVTDANAKALQTFGTQPSQTLAVHSGTAIDKVMTNVKNTKGDVYEITYYLQTPIQCEGNCAAETWSVADGHPYMSQLVTKVEVLRRLRI